MAVNSPRNEGRSDDSVSLRLASADLALTESAEALHDAAAGAAEAVILEQSLVRMQPEDFILFLEALDAPGRPVPELVAVLGRSVP